MSHTTFGRRVTKLADKHRLLSGGVTYRIGPDGLITAYPERRYAPRFPLLGVLALLAGAFAFKVVLFVASGEAPYGERLAELASGGAVEQTLAWVMQPDPATRAVADVAFAALRQIDLP
jgi:hypothetical protein